MADDVAFVRLSAWLTSLCRGFGRPIAVLDIGCGTGRYFSALTDVHDLVGLDASDSMLERARGAARRDGGSLNLIRGDLETCRFEPNRFDLVYAIGVLAEHAPLTHALVQRVSAWLAPGGAFAFTAVHPDSFSIDPSRKRRLGRRLMTIAPGRLRLWLRRRWLADGLYTDEAQVADVLTRAGFVVESIDRLVDVHLHCLAVGRKPASR